MKISIHSAFSSAHLVLNRSVRYFAVISAGLGLFLGGCAPAQRASSDSRIIREVEAAGSGPVENASVQSLFTCFEQHTHLANQITKQCQQVKKTALATWGNSPEGHVCEAAGQSALRHYEP